MVAAFLIFSKVWSQQYVLWLLPLIVLARPRWGAILAWTVAEIGYFTAFYAELLGAGGKPVIPEGTFVLASTPAADHRGGPLRPGGPGDLAAGAGRGPAAPTRRPGRRGPRRGPDAALGRPRCDRGSAVERSRRPAGSRTADDAARADGLAEPRRPAG